jgi:hypothetical protein
MKSFQPDQVLGDMLACLDKYIDSSSSNLPKSSVSIVSLIKRPSAIGNRLGVADQGSFSTVEIKGGRLDAVVRFHLWGNDPEDVDREMVKLQGRLLAARDGLRADGFLTVTLTDSSSPEQITSLTVWRRYADYRMLYEFNYHDVDGALSLISQIPINMDGHITTVSDDLVRWDNQSASSLQAQGRSGRLPCICAVSMMVFLSEGWDGLEVTISASFKGIKKERKFAHLRDFCNSFDLERENANLKTVEFGEKSYLIGRLTFPNLDFPFPLTFQRNDDIFRISYAASSLESSSVVYFRLLG